MGLNEQEKKQLELGHHAQVLLQLHLKDPKKFDAFTIVEKLFNKFEELEMEEDDDDLA